MPHDKIHKYRNERSFLDWLLDKKLIYLHLELKVELLEPYLIRIEFSVCCHVDGKKKVTDIKGTFSNAFFLFVKPIKYVLTSLAQTSN